MSTLQEIARLVREELLTLIRPVQLMSVNPSKATGEVSGRFKSNGVLFDYSIQGGTVTYRPVGSGGSRSDSADHVVGPDARLDAAKGKPRNCTTGFPCGNTCIQKGRKCRAKGGQAAAKLEQAVKMLPAAGQTSGSGSQGDKNRPAAAAAEAKPKAGSVDDEIKRLQRLQAQHEEDSNRSGRYPGHVGREVIAGLQALQNRKEGKPLRWNIHGKNYQIPAAALQGLSPRQLSALIYTKVEGNKPNPYQAFGTWFMEPKTESAGKEAKPKAATKPPSKGPSLKEAKSAVLEAFDVKSVAALKADDEFKMSMAGEEANPLKSKEDWLKLYRRFVKVPENERNLPDGPTVVNGIDVIKNFRPWAVFGLDPKKATASDVRSRFRKLIMQHHPDKGGDPRVAERLKKMRDSMLAFMPDDRKAAGRRDGADPVTAGLVVSLHASRRALQRRWSPARADGYREVLVRLDAVGT